MLSVRIEGDKAVIDGLKQFGEGLGDTVDRGLKRIGAGIHRSAYAFLSGPGSQVGRKKGVAASAAGSYPVSVVTGHLRQLLDWLNPGESKSGEAGTFSAGAHEVVIYDSAAYHAVIHEGTGSSAKFGPRHFLTDALAAFNQGDRIEAILEEEIQKDIKKGGLA